jgi:hypothetical protein
MTLDEKLAIGMNAIEQKNQGNLDEYERISKTIPLPPYLAKWAKDHLGVDFLIEGGWNLAEADAEYGSDWLNQ